MSRELKALPGWARTALQLAVTAGLLALLWQAADGAAAARRLIGADGRWLLAAWLALSVQTLLSAWRWRLTARHLGLALTPGIAIREYFLSQVINQSLPGGMIGDAGRALRSRGPAGLMVAGQAVIFERLAGQVALFAVLALAFTATFLVPGGLDWPGWLVGPVAVFLLAGLSVPLLLRLASRLPGRFGEPLRAWRAALHAAFASPTAWKGQVLLNLGTTLCNLAAFAFCARAVGVVLGLAEIAALVPLILFTMLVPVSVSGWGLREGAAAALLPLAGTTASAGFAASVAFGLIFLLATLPGVFLLRTKPGAQPPKDAPEEPETAGGTIRRASPGCF